MNRLVYAFRAFFSILFQGSLAEEIAAAYGYAPKRQGKTAAAPAAAPAQASAPAVKTSDGALQMLGILQRDSRLIDFLMEDISAYSDDQVGAAVRSLHESCRESVRRYVTLAPVIDGVEGAYTALSAAGASAKDPAAIKLLGNVPADGKAAGGTLRHRGWRAQSVSLPAIPSKHDPSFLAPAEIEIE